MEPSIEIKKGKELLDSEIEMMHKQRLKEYGEDDLNFNEEIDSIFFFVKLEKEVVAFGRLKPISINYLGKKYDILGIGNTISIIKKKGYGKILIYSMIDYLNKRGKTGIGFTGKTNFFKKVGLKTKKGFIKRFRYKNPKTGKIEIDNDGDGIYYEGKDKLVSKMLKTKSLAYSEVDFW